MVTTLTSYDDMREWLKKQTTLVGHNIIRYDIPVLERILGVEIKSKLIDTLALSWYLYPERNVHNLDSWGKDVGVDKPPIDNWDNLPLETYVERCAEDVKINALVWEKQWKYLVKIYEDKKDIMRLLGYLSFKLKCARLQEESKWKLDVAHVEEKLAELEAIKQERHDSLIVAMPQSEKTVVKTKPAKPFKKDGTPSVLGAKWQALLKEHGKPKDYNGEIEVVVAVEEGNPNSHPQLKKWLYELGWEPTTFKYDRNKETNEIREIAQISLPHGQGLCPSVKKLYEVEPELGLLDGLFVVTHRISMLKAFLNNADDNGYVTASIQGLTNTLRFQHANPCVNLPGVDRAYGKYIRGSLIAPEGYELCGSDMASLEDRTKQHYMWPHDPEYVKEMNTEGFDPHLDIGVLAGMMTQTQADEYKAGDKSLNSVRHNAKQVNYSCTYGVTPKGIVRNTGMEIGDATTLHKTYWKRNWALKAIEDEVEVKTVNGKKWLYNPVSKLYYSLRYDKDKFSTLNQGTGTYCFDRWVHYVLSKRKQLTAQFHDEIVLCIKKGNREKAQELLKWAITKVNEELKLNRELDIDVQFGDNYAEIH